MIDMAKTPEELAIAKLHKIIEKKLRIAGFKTLLFFVLFGSNVLAQIKFH
jgi:hypothetical protein